MACSSDLEHSVLMAGCCLTKRPSKMLKEMDMTKMFVLCHNGSKCEHNNIPRLKEG